MNLEAASRALLALLSAALLSPQAQATDPAEPRFGRNCERQQDRAAERVGHDLEPVATDLYYQLVMREPQLQAAEHRLYYGPHPLQFGDLRLPHGRGPFPVAIVVHGGGWSAGAPLHYMASVATYLSCLGIATRNVEYRTLGAGGEWPTVLRDVSAAADHVRSLALRYPIDPQRVISVGQSAGGHLALWLGARPRLHPESDVYSADPLPLRAMITLTGPPDLERFAQVSPVGFFARQLVGTAAPAVLAQRIHDASPAALLPLGRPHYVIAGAADAAVPPLLFDEYLVRARQAGDRVEMAVVAGGGHFDPAGRGQRPDRSRPAALRVRSPRLALKTALSPTRSADREFPMEQAFARLVAAAGVLVAAAAAAQPKEQFFPVLVYRTGAYAPNGVPFANGYVDYLKLVNARGSIHGVKTVWEECEFGYATDRGVECYERMKGKNGGATVFHPLSTGVTFALSEKVATDRIPLLTPGYGRSDSADGMVFKWNFPLMGTYWDAADILLKHVSRKDGGLDSLRGNKIALVYHNSPFGKEPIALLQERSKMHGFEPQLLPVVHPGIEQKSVWLQVRQARPDHVFLWGWGVMNPTALKEAQATGYPRERIHGVWWSGSEPDVKDVGDGAKGYSALTLQHSAEPQSAVVQEVLEKVHSKGQGTGPRQEVGSVLYMRGLKAAMLSTEGVRRAQERFGRGQWMSAERARWATRTWPSTRRNSTRSASPACCAP